MSKLTRWILPSMLTALGFGLLGGCFFIPRPDEPFGGSSPAQSVGPARSDRPLRVEQASRAEVERTLGPPQFISRDGLRSAYTWRVTSGAYVWPLCFQSFPRHGTRTLVLRFDEAGTLRSSNVLKANEPFSLSALSPAPPPLPEDMIPVPQEPPIAPPER